MFEVPTLSPVTRPEFETLATPALLETHGLLAAAVPLPFNCRVPFKHNVFEPVITGLAFTVTVVLALQPKLLV